MNEIMISVILPVYNGQRYLKSAIQSVLSQNGVQFELVIVDDASTDSSAEIIKSLAHDSNLRHWTNEVNHGLFYTMNKAVERCSYSLIKVWAQDDVMKPGCLKCFADVMVQSRDAGFYWCQSELIDESWELDSNMKSEVQRAEDGRGMVLWESWTLTKSIGHFFWCGNLHGNISLMAFHKSAFDLVGGFDEAMSYSGDIDFTARLLRTKTPVCIVSDLVWLRSHTGQLSRSSRHLFKELTETKSVFDFLLDGHSDLLSNSDLGRFCKRSYVHRSLPYFVSNSLLVMSELSLVQGLKMLWALNSGLGVIHSLWYWFSRRHLGKRGPRLHDLPLE